MHAIPETFPLTLILDPCFLWRWTFRKPLMVFGTKTRFKLLFFWNLSFPMYLFFRFYPISASEDGDQYPLNLLTIMCFRFLLYPLLFFLLFINSLFLSLHLLFASTPTITSFIIPFTFKDIPFNFK